MSIRIKILGGFLIVCLLGMAVGATGLMSTQKLATKTNDLLTYSNQSDDFSHILNAHYAWRNGLMEAILNDGEFHGSLDPSACALGQWLNSDEAKNINDPTLQNLLSRVTDPHDLIHHNAEEVMNLLKAGNRDGAIYSLTNNIQPAFSEVITDLIAIGDRYSQMVLESTSEVSDISSTARNTIFVLIIVAILGSVLLAFLIADMVCKPLRSITEFMDKAGSTGDITLKPADIKIIEQYSKKKDELGKLMSAMSSFVGRITKTSSILETIANGDLTAELPLLSDKDTMGLAFKKMLHGLNKMFLEINTSASQVSLAANQVADGAQSLASGSTEQAATIEELSSSIADIAERTKANATKAEEAAQLANIIKSNANNGGHQMNEMMTAVSQIHEASQSINKVIKTIDDIAFQTKILALNATVEAARAGQHGKGFAVVADEVKTLAAKSAEAAHDTEALIANSMDKAELGVQIAQETAASLSEIISGINNSGILVQEIAHLSEEQSQSISQINTNVEQVAQVIQNNSATAQESAAASEDMNGQSAILQDLIAQFKISENHDETHVLPSSGKKSSRKSNNLGKQAAFGHSELYGAFGKY